MSDETALASLVSSATRGKLHKHNAFFVLAQGKHPMTASKAGKIIIISSLQKRNFYAKFH